MAGSNQPLGDLPHRRFVEIDERHGGARLGNRLCAREAHPRSSAGDKRDFVFKRQVRNVILSEAARLRKGDGVLSRFAHPVSSIPTSFDAFSIPQFQGSPEWVFE